MADKYAALYFSKDESAKYREFLRAMNGVKIIMISREQIDLCVEEFERDPVGLTVRLVLHGDEEADLFRHVMRVFFDGLEYEITDDPDDKAFADWLEEKRREKDHGSKDLHLD